jgi:hypothetical protein
MGTSLVHSQRRLIVAPAEPAAADKICTALSFNGRTSDSDSLDRGSNPWGATKNLYVRPRRAFFFALFHTSSDFRDQPN